MTPLQKRALYALLAGLVLTVALAAAMVLHGDVATFGDSEGRRYILYAAMVGVPLVYLLLVKLTLRRPSQIDERDRLVMDRAGRVQWVAVLISSAAWIITLTEAYRSSGQVPAAYLTIIFVSILIISVLAQSLGILLGYRGLK